MSNNQTKAKTMINFEEQIEEVIEENSDVDYAMYLCIFQFICAMRLQFNRAKYDANQHNNQNDITESETMGSIMLMINS